MNDVSPIIFCHYGNRSKYLPYVLSCVRRSNPSKPVILLGDSENKWLAKRFKLQFYNFEDYSNSPEIREFDKVYQLVEGARHGSIRGKRDWVNFVFRRWFHIYQFAQDHGLQQFWHFDSDNMIMEPLDPYEAPFSKYDCTEQCGGSCLNGFISNLSTVRDYLKCINELFSDESYLSRVREELVSHPDWAFTEMRAFVEFKRRYGPKVKHAREPLNHASFDDCICQSYGVEMEYFKELQKEIKKIYLTDRGCFVNDQRWSCVPRMPVVNLSWVSLSFFYVLERYVRKQKFPLDVRSDVPLESLSDRQTLGAQISKSWGYLKFICRMKDLLRRMKLWA